MVFNRKTVMLSLSQKERDIFSSSSVLLLSSPLFLFSSPPLISSLCLYTFKLFHLGEANGVAVSLSG